MMTLPKEYLARMQAQLGGEYPRYREAMEQKPRRSLRVNSLKCSAEELFSCLKPKSIWDKNGLCDLGYIVPDDFDVGQSLAHAQGLFYMQEASSQVPALYTEAAAGELVLDMCAAPGGKSTQLAAMLEGKGLLVSNEIVRSRAQVLVGNIERMGITNALVLNQRPDSFDSRFIGLFDAVLVDAPCAGEGMFRKNPAAAEEWSESSVTACAARQSAILDSAAPLVRAGGRLVYSTCSFSREENENNVDSFIQRHPEFELMRFEKLYPHSCAGEGQSVALFYRKGEGERRVFAGTYDELPIAAKKRSPALYEFLCEYVDCKRLPKGELKLLADGRAYVIPPLPFELSGLQLVRGGLLLGESRGKHFIPSHALAMCAPNTALINSCELDESEARSYLRGLSLNVNAPKGWLAVTYKGYAMGLGKAADNVIKNHYPKGLRIN